MAMTPKWQIFAGELGLASPGDRPSLLRNWFLVDVLSWEFDAVDRSFFVAERLRVIASGASPR
jgi:hypothetical protein